MTTPILFADMQNLLGCVTDLFAIACDSETEPGVDYPEDLTIDQWIDFVLDQISDGFDVHAKGVMITDEALRWAQDGPGREVIRGIFRAMKGEG